MTGHHGLIGVSAILFSISAASATITPSWRINAITPAAITNSGGVLGPGSISVSLMVELTNGSQISGGGIDLTFAPDLRFYQWRRFGDDALDPPTPDDISQFPNAAFDTLSRLNIIGPLTGPGPAQRANTDLQPTSGDDRFGRLLNVAWGSDSGGIGSVEILKLTFLNASPGSTTIPIEFGLVRDSLNPNAAVTLPPIPVVVPEPASWGLLVTVGFAGRLWRRKSS